jgi:hypothetical protein
MGQIYVSGEYQQGCWLRLRSDPLEQLRAYASARGSTLLSAGDAVYELELRGATSTQRPVFFSWKQHRGFPLPPLEGTVAAMRLGPFVNVLLRARYQFSSDIASQLLHEAVGEEMAQRALKRILKAISLVLHEALPMDRNAALIVFPAQRKDH